MAGKRKQKAKEKPRKQHHTLQSPIVIALAEWLALPFDLRPDDAHTIKDFGIKMGYSDKSSQSFYNMQEIPGFDNLRKKFENKYKSHYVFSAKRGLLKRANGIMLTEEVINPKTGEIETLQKEIPPETKACETILKLFDNFKDEATLTISYADKVKKAAEALENGEDK